ncbi:MAG: hypothetical protein ORN54_02175, partial [Cyclobacteriaceae bacterium]|nr:hypothetical protein [Cyclobacteriaceae bacterium]
IVYTEKDSAKIFDNENQLSEEPKRPCKIIRGSPIPVLRKNKFMAQDNAKKRPRLYTQSEYICVFNFVHGVS